MEVVEMKKHYKTENTSKYDETNMAVDKALWINSIMPYLKKEHMESGFNIRVKYLPVAA